MMLPLCMLTSGLLLAKSKKRPFILNCRPIFVALYALNRMSDVWQFNVTPSAFDFSTRYWLKI